MKTVTSALRNGAPLRAVLPVLVTFNLLCAFGAAAAEPEKALQRGYMVILGGGKTAADAEAVVKGYQPQKQLTLPAEHPRVIESATVEGLKPGFFIAVAGACASKRAAEEARDVLGFLSNTGVYVREVRVPEATLQDCPRLQPAALEGDFDPDSFRVLRKVPLDTARPTLTWVIRKKRPKGGCDIFDVAVQAGDTLLAHESYEADGCNKPVGTHRSWHEVNVVEVGTARFVQVTAIADWHDNGNREQMLFDFACGGLTEVARVSEGHMNDVQEFSLIEGKSPREALRMRWRRADCRDCRQGNAVLDYQRSSDCTYKVTPAPEG